MRNLTRAEHAVARFEVEALGTDFNNVFAFQRIEEFVYIVVKVAGWPALLLIRLF